VCSVVGRVGLQARQAGVKALGTRSTWHVRQAPARRMRDEQYMLQGMPAVPAQPNAARQRQVRPCGESRVGRRRPCPILSRKRSGVVQEVPGGGWC